MILLMPCLEGVVHTLPPWALDTAVLDSLQLAPLERLVRQAVPLRVGDGQGLSVLHSPAPQSAVLHAEQDHVRRGPQGSFGGLVICPELQMEDSTYIHRTKAFWRLYIRTLLSNLWCRADFILTTMHFREQESKHL